MLILASTSDVIQVVTSAASQIEVHASYVDFNGTTVTPGRTNTAHITTATTTTVVPNPGVSTQRNVKHLNITNDHTSATCAITVEHSDGTTVEELIEEHGGKVTASVSKATNYLLAGDGGGGKRSDAEKFGVKVISENDLISMI